MDNTSPYRILLASIVCGISLLGWNAAGADDKRTTMNSPLIYHGVATHHWSSFVTPGPGQAEAIEAEVKAYEAAAGRSVAWVEFGHEWETDGPIFPWRLATTIRNMGATPLIFLNLRSVDEGVDPVYTLTRIISGQYDSDLAAWADEAKKFGSELIVNWGWEMNGDFTPWNGFHNGSRTLGPRRFKKAYRHIIELMIGRGATNIRWGFHVNFPEYPEELWNAFEQYYPGDDVIDCVGVSIYGASTPTDDSIISFVSNMDAAYSRLVRMAPKKPVFVFELGTSAHPDGNQAAWADEALSAILSGRWPKVRGFAWWNDYWNWENDSDSANDTEMRVEAVPELASVFKTRLASGNLGDRPPVLVLPAPLKTLAEQRGVRFGAYYQYDMRSDVYDRVFEREMNAMALGAFWDNDIRRTYADFNLAELDAKVAWGRERDMEMYGQTLVWFEDVPDWLKAMPPRDVERIMNEHIDTVVGRYAGQIKAWNVVNEAVDDHGTLRRKHKWAEAMGDDYIRKAFVRAHAADPTAILYYNEFDIESNTAKYNGVKALLINLKKQGVPIHALGWQLHVRPGSFDAATLLARMNEIADLGFDNYITELDVKLPTNANAADYEQQKQIYDTVVRTFLAARRHKSIVVWGLRDSDPYWLTKNHPLLFDANFRKKASYFGVQEALMP